MAFLKRIQHRAIISRWGFTLLGRNISGKTQPLVHPSVSVPEDECSRIKAITTNNVWQRWIGRQNKEEGGFGEVMTGGLLWLMHTFPASVTFGIITTQRWRAAIVKRGLPQIQLQQHSTRFSAPFSDEKDERGLMAVKLPDASLLIPPARLTGGISGQANTCTWLHATHGKTIFCGVLWKSSPLPVQARSGEQHILWRALGVSVKGICHAVFTEWVRFRPMRATERAARFLWKQLLRCQIITLTVFWNNCWLFCSR